MSGILERPRRERARRAGMQSARQGSTRGPACGENQILWIRSPKSNGSVLDHGAQS